MTDEPTVSIYCPVGQKEFDLVRESGFRALPPRRPFLPIFFWMPTEEYAVRVVQDWSREHAALGDARFIIRFQVPANLLVAYPAQNVGGRTYGDYWLPPDEMDAFNRHIVGPVEVVAEFRP